MKSTFLRILGIGALCFLLMGAFSCKSKKKLAEAEAEKARQEQMEAERQARAEEEARRQQEEEERLAREREAAEAANEPTQKLNQYFNAISNASSSTAAERSINEALTMFSSGDVPVLIIIYENEAENTTDYDEPTTISKYLQYLKDVKRQPDTVKSMKFGSNGKITELILKK